MYSGYLPPIFSIKSYSNVIPYQHDPTYTPQISAGSQAPKK